MGGFKDLCYFMSSYPTLRNFAKSCWQLKCLGGLGGADAAADHKSAFTSGNYNFYLLAIVTSQCSISGNICGVQASVCPTFCLNKYILKIPGVKNMVTMVTWRFEELSVDFSLYFLQGAII